MCDEVIACPSKFNGSIGKEPSIEKRIFSQDLVKRAV